MADQAPKMGDSKPKDRYEGLDVPSPRNSANDPNVTIEGGAFWVNGELRNADGEVLSDEKIAEFKKVQDARKKSQ